jgi:hypothetical protein
MLEKKRRERVKEIKVKSRLVNINKKLDMEE